MATTKGCAALAAMPCAKVGDVICPAGVLANDDFRSIDLSGCAWQFDTDALGPLRCVQALPRKLREGSKAVFTGSKLGSFEGSTPGRRVRALLLAQRHVPVCEALCQSLALCSGRRLGAGSGRSATECDLDRPQRTPRQFVTNTTDLWWCQRALSASIPM